MGEVVSINGVISRPEDAKISVFDRGFLFGDSVYEVARTYGSILLYIEAHLDRLLLSAQRIHMDLGQTRSQLLETVYQVVGSSQLEDVYMRIQVTRGEGPIGMNPSLAESPNTVIYVKKFQPYPLSLYSEGCVIATTELLRNSKRALDPNIKSGNYLNNVLAYADKMSGSPQEVLLMNTDGFVTEGCTSNVFIVKAGKLITAPEAFDILKGITRGLVIDLARSNGILVEERGFTVTELEDADEVFLTSSTREVMPVGLTNRVRIKNSPGPVTKILANAYKSEVTKYCSAARATHPWNRRGAM